MLALALATRFPWPPKSIIGITAIALYAIWIMTCLPREKRLLLIPGIAVLALLAVPDPFITQTLPIGIRLLLLLLTATVLYAATNLALTLPRLNSRQRRQQQHSE